MIVFICGAVNAGKSTVGKMLAKRIGAAFVEGDDIRKFIYWQTVEEARPIIVDTIASAVRSLAEHQLSVVVAYPLWEEDHKPLLKALKGIKSQIRFFALNPDIEAAVINRGTRELEDWEVKFIKELYARGVNNPSFAESIDNTNIPAEETVEMICGRLAA